MAENIEQGTTIYIFLLLYMSICVDVRETERGDYRDYERSLFVFDYMPSCVCCSDSEFCYITWSLCPNKPFFVVDENVWSVAFSAPASYR